MIKPNVDINNQTILITGIAGFIGGNIAIRLLETCNSKIIGIDNINDYYDIKLKEYRLNLVKKTAEKKGREYCFVKGDLADKEFMSHIFTTYTPDIVINLAAQAGVRHSIENPDAYISSNVIGFYNILEECRHSYDTGRGVKHLVYASSSSVYGTNNPVPYSTETPVDRPVSLYAATKKTDELFAHAYSKLYNIPCTALRFFTVYGPAGRPDMAYFKFADKLYRGETIQIYNYGNCQRDFTYIDDILEGIAQVIVRAPERENGKDGLPIAPYRIYNIGNNHPEQLMDFVQILADEMMDKGLLDEKFDINEHIELLPMQPGDVEITYADVTNLERDCGFKPQTDLKQGLEKFVEWYKGYKE